MRRRRADERVKTGGKVDRNASAAPQDGEEDGSKVIRGKVDRNASAAPQDGGEDGGKVIGRMKH